MLLVTSCFSNRKDVSQNYLKANQNTALREFSSLIKSPNAASEAAEQSLIGLAIYGSDTHKPPPRDWVTAPS